MLKRLAILGLLLPLASALGMAAQSAPADAPKSGATEQSTRKAGSQQASPNQGNANSPIPVPINVKTSGSSNKQESDSEKENLDIQRKLEWFTFGLVIVGLMQAFTMIWQARLLRGTLRQIQTQAGHMERQTKILEDSVAAAQKSADAAIAQVEGAKRTQRAQLRIEFADFDFGLNYEGCPVRFTVTLDGTTRAYMRTY
jgi:ABC-type multidrug transport system fused ATPase/permease subunit